MKKFLLVLWAGLFCGLLASAQEANGHKNSITVDAAGIVGRMFAQDQPRLPYQLMYRHFMQNGNALRVGTGILYNSDEVQEGDDLTTNQNNRLDFRLGFENRTPLGQKWMLAFGVDALVETGRILFSEKSGTNTYEDETVSTGVGGALILGIHCDLSERVSIGTESSLEFVRTDMQNSIHSTFEDTAESSTQDISTRFQVVMPAMLLIGIRF